MSITNPFALHRQGVWLERAADETLPNWVRLAALAFARHRGNGHANFCAGEIAKLLAASTPSGDRKPMSHQAVSNTIARAKSKGWIADESTARCLVVPHHAVEGGLGKSWDKCRFHGR